MFMFFPSYKLPFLRGWSIATVDYREYIQKTTNPQVTRLVMNRLLSASLRQCWAVPIIEYIGIFGSSLSMQPSGKKNICNSWVVLRCFEYASTSSINSPTTINPRPTFPTKRWPWRPGARPIGWCGAWPKRHQPMVSERPLWHGKLSKSEKTNHSALTSLFADFRFKYHYWLVVCNIWIIFPYIGNVIIPTDKLIFFRGVGIPPTSMDIFHSPLTCQVCEIWWREFNTNMIVIVCDESYS